MELNEELDGLAVDIGQDLSPTRVPARRAIVVVGSHRSGTSALSRVLSLLGCDLPKHVMPPLAGNELGFWEPEAVVHTHNAFLRSIGSSWDDVGALPAGAFVSVAARELRQELALLLREEYGTSPLFVVKDPRISRLLPLWFAVLAELQVAPAVAVAVRNPLEVAASLKARDGFTTTKSLVVWLRHTLESEEHSRGRPRSIVMYDELLRNWQGVLERVGEDLAIRWPGKSHRATVEIEKFLSEQQRHHVFDWRDVEGRADVVSWVKEAYFALRGSDSLQVLDQVRHELTQADIAFGPILEEARLDLQASQAETLESATARDALGKDMEARNLALEARAAEVQQLQEQVGELNSAIAASVSQVATHRAAFAALQAERDRLAHEVERFGDEAGHLTAAVEAAQGRVDVADAVIASTREELNTAYAEVDRLRATADEAVSRAALLEANSSAERESLLTDLDVARATIEQLEERAASAHTALGALEAQAASDRGELLQELTAARADAERLTARIFAAESEAAAERSQLLADLDAANADKSRLGKQLEDTSLDVEELASTAETLLSFADAELEASRAEQDRLRSEFADRLEEHGQLLSLVEHLEAALRSAQAALTEREQAADALVGEFAARRAEFDAERTRLLNELGAARADLENARSEVEPVRNELQMLTSEATSDRAALKTERDAARREVDNLVAELETSRAHAEGLAADTAELEAALDAQKALLHVLQSVTNRRTSRLRSLSQLGTWLLPPTPRKLNYLRRYLVLRRSGQFDVDAYLLANHDVLMAGINPLMHYVEYGSAEGRTVGGHLNQPNREIAAEISPSDAVDPEGQDASAPAVEVGWAGADEQEGGSADADEQDDETIVRASGLFDARFYLDQNVDVREAGVDSIVHYVTDGHIEGRDPSADFQTTYYRAKYLNGNRAVNPLVHYSTVGRRAGNHTAPGAHDNADDVHLSIRESVRPGSDFEERDADLAGSRSVAKALAFYLPQFHPVAENDEWWGTGFTEWRNVARGTARFAGHYQPRIPRDLGFYDLRQPDVMRRQVEMARGAGLFGFAFYYYWFDGKRLLERPLDGFLDDPTIDFPFCLAWANENWTRRWDGREDDLLIAQRYEPDHDVELVDDLQRHFLDHRYIRLQGRPLLLLYRVDCIPDAARRIERWRELWQSRHDEEPLIFVAQAFGSTDPRQFGVDGAFEFPPHKLVERVSAINSQLTILDPGFRGHVVAYEDVVREALAEPIPAYPFIRTAVPSWDNDARRPGEGLTLHGSTPAIYERWVRTLAESAARQPVFGEPLVFVNAWNEWAEGAYLEPDVHYGAAYLNATARALSNDRPTAKRKVLLVGHDAHRHGAQMIIRNIGETLSRQFGCEVAWLLLGGGAMVPEYEQLGRVWVADNDPTKIAAAVAELRRDGFEFAVANTTLSGIAVPHLKAEGFRVVSLIHELPGIIGELRAEESLAAILEQSDTIVVPAENVANAIASDASPDVRRRIVVQPQGLYNELEQPPDARMRLRRRLGIGDDSRIVLNVGFGDLRKGIDTFVHIAKLAAARAEDMHFVWVGNLHGDAERWLSGDSGDAVRNRIHFVPYEVDVAEFYFGADAFFLSSREDPFPSVVLEALTAGLPVVGFVGASGTEELIAEHGRLVDRDDLAGVVIALDEATRQDDERARSTRTRVVAERFRYDDYCFDLLQLLEPELEAVSVVVPNYNYERYLSDRMQSVFDQTYPVFETLVLDDCSTDESLARLAEVATASGRRFRLVTNEENSGSPFAQWERGCGLARGKYVWVAEADDGSDPRFLEEVVTRQRRDGASFAFSDSVPVDQDGATLASSYKPYYRESVGNLMDSSFVLDGKSFLERCLAERNLVLNASAVVWERETLLEALASSRDALRDYRLAGDWQLYAAAALSAERVAYLSSPLNVHRRHDSSVTATLNGRKHVDEVERVQRFVAEALGENDVARRRMRTYADHLRDQFGVVSESEFRT